MMMMRMMMMIIIITTYYTMYVPYLQIDINQATLGDILTRVIKSKLGFNEPSIMHGSTFLYEEGDGADEDLVSNLAKTLIQCKIVDGSQLVIEDFSQNLEVRCDNDLVGSDDVIV